MMAPGGCNSQCSFGMTDEAVRVGADTYGCTSNSELAKLDEAIKYAASVAPWTGSAAQYLSGPSAPGDDPKVHGTCSAARGKVGTENPLQHLVFMKNTGNTSCSTFSRSDGQGGRRAQQADE